MLDAERALTEISEMAVVTDDGYHNPTIELPAEALTILMRAIADRRGLESRDVAATRTEVGGTSSVGLPKLIGIVSTNDRKAA